MNHSTRIATDDKNAHLYDGGPPFRQSAAVVGALFLHKAGMIRYSGGHITVLDQCDLENLTCECYGVVKKDYDRLLRAKKAH